MGKTKGASRTASKPRAAKQGADLARTLESLLEKSQRSADRLAELLERSERAAADLVPDAGPQGTAGEALEQRLGELTSHAEQLETARAVAEAADQAKSCFLAAMSRELRTPVDGLARMIELLQQTDVDEEQRQYLATANHSVYGLMSLLDSVLSASKVDAGVADLRTTDFDLRRLLDQTVDLMQPAARRRGLRIDFDVQSEVPTLLRGEAGRLRQILLYAMRRAIQLAAQGEISVSASVTRATESTTTIRFTLSHGDTRITREEVHRAFAPTKRLENLHVRPEGGRGIGLAIARQMAELMGGRMDIDHDAGDRFTIWFTLPLDNYRQANDDRRAHGRLPQELLQSSLGPVLDLSMGGMRVQCSKSPKGEIEVELADHEAPVVLRATVMWTKKLGFRKHEVGLSFPHVPPDVAKKLTRVSLNHRLRRLLGM